MIRFEKNGSGAKHMMRMRLHGADRRDDGRTCEPGRCDEGLDESVVKPRVGCAR
jgi:hypothetical protein